jgi:hypothetical protein
MTGGKHSAELQRLIERRNQYGHDAEADLASILPSSDKAQGR